VTSPEPLAGIDAIADVYGLGAVRECRFLTDGLLNRNWRVEAEAGVFALKELDALDPDSARRSLALMRSVAEDGVPVVEAIAAADGETVVEIGSGAYYLAPWVDGSHYFGPDMDAAASRHMGELIGRIHRALARPGLLPKAGPVSAPVTGPGEARERIGDYLGHIARLEAPDAFDTAAEPILRARLEAVAANEHLRPVGEEPVGPYGWTHGDCQNWNLIWRDRRIAAVLDWDRVRVNPYGEEIVRASMYQCALDDGSVDLGNVAALIAGYRSVAPIDSEALADAARRRWWKLLSSVWQLKYHYYRGDSAADAVFFSGELQLLWWTANLDKVESVFGA
jgi:Ser/Thr protein kinase RdoA (MazF antagonist)